MNSETYTSIVCNLRRKKLERIAELDAEYESHVAELDSLWVACGNDGPPPSVDEPNPFAFLEKAVDDALLEDNGSPDASYELNTTADQLPRLRGSLSKLVGDAIAAIGDGEQFSIVEIRSQLKAIDPSEEADISNVALTHVLRRLTDRNEIEVAIQGQGRRASTYRKVIRITE